MRLGEHTISTEKDCDDPENEKTCNPPVQDIEIERIITHEGHDNKKKINDIALIRLKEAADIDRQNIATICLPMKTEQKIENIENDPGEDVKTMIISGWGKTEKQSNSDVLLQAFVPYIEQSECVKNFVDISRRFSENIEIQDTHLV